MLEQDHGRGGGRRRRRVPELDPGRTHLGKPGLYHATITYAFLLLINERMQDGPASESWDAFRQRNADLFQGVQAALGRYYSEARLASDRSRAGFVMPDRLVG